MHEDTQYYKHVGIHRKLTELAFGIGGSYDRRTLDKSIIHVRTNNDIYQNDFFKLYPYVNNYKHTIISSFELDINELKYNFIVGVFLHTVK
jgi:hypothetical protein